MTRRPRAMMRAVLCCCLTPAALTLLFACDEVDADPIVLSSSSRGSGIPDSGLTSSRLIPLQCSSSPVRVNSPCSQEQARCEYGVSPDPKCNTLYVCATDNTYGAFWDVETPASCGAECPAPSQIVDGAPCAIDDAGPEDELHCTTPQGACICTTGHDGAHAHARTWVCMKLDDGCPNQRPLFGQPCVGHAECDYGSCVSKRGERMICADDVWQTELGQCPN